ncbi:MAG: isoprenylcysteine carboxylmethyltransferase family protein [Actinomycetota bacterium]|nr:isoprenylcysteine carboxylmethyltransferase family protein [Actinomycetota bacterium]
MTMPVGAESPTASRDTAEVIAPPPLIYLGGLAIGFVLDVLLPEASLPGGVRWGLGGVLLAAGLGLLGWWIGSFRRTRTPMPPWQPTTALVTDGPYRLSRNPAYLADAMIFAAIALLADAPWVLLALPPVLAVMQQGVIKREERYLERRFGQQYGDLKARTRRWI